MDEVYIGMTADLFHYGHMNIINVGKKYGKVIVGILTDEAVESYKRKPVIPYEYRKYIVQNIIGVYKVVAQTTLSYTNNLRKYKPKYVVHGDDWKTGIQTKTRNDVINVLSEWDGILIEPKYTEKISTSYIIKKIIKEYS
jgi:phosphoenolpyruvate phosphomutase / 2-hydroxyethylphosphonate cytidylyltransferase